MSSKPQVVVVTGASGGVGRAIAHAFAKRGAHIGLLARGREGLDGAAREVETLGGRALAVPTDVSEHDQVEAAAVAVEEQFGEIDVWVNDAMATVFARFTDTEPREFERTTEVTCRICAEGDPVRDPWRGIGGVHHIRARAVGSRQEP